MKQNFNNISSTQYIQNIILNYKKINQLLYTFFFFLDILDTQSTSQPRLAMSAILKSTVRRSVQGKGFV